MYLLSELSRVGLGARRWQLEPREDAPPYATRILPGGPRAVSSDPAVVVAVVTRF
jgi:hypothetical protein